MAVEEERKREERLTQDQDKMIYFIYTNILVFLREKPTAANVN